MGETIIKNKIIPVANMFTSIGVESQQAVISLGNVVSGAAKQYNINITDPAEYKDLIDASFTIMTEKNNEFAEEYQATESSMGKDSNEFKIWKNTKWIPKVRDFGFTYNPTKIYRELIGGQE